MLLHSLTTGKIADQALAWLLTYALHSTLLLGVAWGASHRLGGRALRLQETIWRCALAGALVTASVQLAFGRLGHAPIAGGWTLAAIAAPGPAGAQPAAPAVAGARRVTMAGAPAATAVGGQPAATPLRHAGSAAAASATNAATAGAGPQQASQVLPPDAGAPIADLAARAPDLGAGVAAAPTAAAGLPPVSRAVEQAARQWPRLLLPAWLLGALALTIAYARSHLVLRRRLRYRPQVVGGGVLARLARLVRESGLSRKVRLTCTWRLSVPVALGARQAEVCVPPRALFHLDDEQQDALLAHELAHLARRDPLWLPLTSLVVNVLFFQPLNWLARRRLRELSELLCDEWAVAHTGRPLSLAGCLAEVAGWSVGRPGRHGAARKAARLPVPGMAGRPSHLAHRIRRLLDAPAGEGRRPARRDRAVLVAVVPVVLAAVILAAPGISAGSASAGSPTTSSAVAAGDATAATAAASEAEAAGKPAASPVSVAVSPRAGRATTPSAPGPISVAALAPAADQQDVQSGSRQPAPLAGTVPASPAPAPAPAAPAAGTPPDATPASPPDLVAESERLAEAAVRLEHLDKLTTLSKEQIAAMNAAVERISREIDGKMRESLEQLAHQLTASRAHHAELPPAELADLDRELAAMAAKLRPSREDLARMDAELRKLATEHPLPSAKEIERFKKDLERSLEHMPPTGLTKEDVEHLRAEAKRLAAESAAAARPLALSPAEREKIVADAHRLAEQLRPDQAQLDSLRALVRDQQELTRQLAAQRAEIESMRREILRETEALRDQARRLSEARRLRPKRQPAPHPQASPAPHSAAPAPPPAASALPPPPPAAEAPPAPPPPESATPPPPACR
jgi:hypothetical protein